MTYSVRDEPDFSPTYTEDEQVTIRKGDLRAVLDALANSLDFGSGFLDNEQVEALRDAATILGIDPDTVTPPNFRCVYGATPHLWQRVDSDLGRALSKTPGAVWRCVLCDRGTVDPPTEGEMIVRYDESVSGALMRGGILGVTIDDGDTSITLDLHDDPEHTMTITWSADGTFRIEEGVDG